MNDVQLVEKHRQGCNDAFAELVRRHLGWIYGVALRRLGDRDVAEDVSQSVFIVLHRKLPHFKSDRTLMAWLYKTAGYAAETAARSRIRRMQHEARAAIRQDSVTEGRDNDWEALSPILDEIIGGLARGDREAILLRYFRQMTFEQVAREIGTTTEAARKRVDRAIEKLRMMVDRQGLALSTLLLGDALARNVAPGAHAKLTATVVSAAGHGATGVFGGSTAAIVKGTAAMMATAQLKIVVALAAGILMAGGAATFVISTSETTASAAADPFPKLSPFAAVSWSDAGYRVRVDGKWYELLGINDQPASKVIEFARSAYPGDLWQKRVDEDLVEVMAHMGAAPGNSVTLKLRPIDGGNPVTVANVAMTSANRWAIWEERNKAGGAATTRNVAATRGVAGDARAGRVDFKVSPFSAVRWNGAKYEVEVRGKWYELVSIEGESAQRITDYARQAYRNLWQKRIDEDLPDVLAGLGHGYHPTVKLELRAIDNGEVVVLAAEPMTSENRQAIWERRQINSEQKPR